MSSGADRLAEVTSHIAEAARAAGRSPSDVTLVAVSKTHGADRVRELLEVGHRVFGENRVQEAEGKFPDLKAAFPDLELHLIGPLQTNKTKEAVAFFDVIETLDREKLARALAEQIQKRGRSPRMLIQVNTGAEPQKAGVLPKEADAFIAISRETYGLTVEGLMAIPPAEDAPGLHFALLARIAERNGLPVLSMGMSGDYETAIRFGATHVRVGTALFGERNSPEAPSIA